MELINESLDPNSEYSKIKKEYSAVIQNISREDKYSNFIGGLPITLERKDCYNLFSRDPKGNYRYSVTQKVDGIRVLLFASYKNSSGSRHICFVDRENRFYNIKNIKNESLPAFDGPKLLIDGELIMYKVDKTTTNDLSEKYYNIKSFSFMAFDILYGPISLQFEGQFNDTKLEIGSEGAMAGPLGGKLWPYMFRYNILYSLIVPPDEKNESVTLKDYRPILSLAFEKCEWFTVEIKVLYSISSFNRPGNVYDFFKKELVKSRKEFYTLVKSEYMPVKLDGLIFTPFDTNYVIGGVWNEYNNIQYKWKPSDEQSIDFYIDYFGNNPVLKIKIGINLVSFDELYGVDYKIQKFDKVKPGTIGEFIYSNGEFRLKNLRKEKNSPNAKSTALNVFNVIKNPVDIDALKYFIELNKPKINETKYLRYIHFLKSYLPKSKLLTCIINKDVNKFPSREKIESNLIKFKENDDLEFEIRLGYLNKGQFISNLAFNLYKKVISSLSSKGINYDYNIYADVFIEKDGKRIRNRYKYFKEINRSILIDSIIKSNIENINIDMNSFYNIDTRFSLSREEKYIIQQDDPLSNYSLEKHRYSFDMGIISIDCTEIIDRQIHKKTYQVELEVKDKRCEYSDIIKTLTELLNLIN